jgi:starch phosphorylase
MPEALETWPVRMFETLLPRHLEIVYRINQHFLDDVRARFPGDERLVQQRVADRRNPRPPREDGGPGGAGLASRQRRRGTAFALMVDTIFADFARLFPERFHQRHQRRHPAALAAAVQSRFSIAARRHHRVANGVAIWARCRGCGTHAADAAVGRRFAEVKRANKAASRGVDPSRSSAWTSIRRRLFDVQIKRIHEYKRQLLNLLHVAARYQAMLDRPAGPDGRGWTPRTVVMAGKAASAYHTAKSDRAPRPRHRSRRQQRLALGRQTQTRVPAELRRKPCRNHRAGGRICPNRSPPPAPKPRAPAT